MQANENIVLSDSYEKQIILKYRNTTDDGRVKMLVSICNIFDEQESVWAEAKIQAILDNNEKLIPLSLLRLAQKEKNANRKKSRKDRTALPDSFR